MPSALVVGAGLIGTSIGLALHGHWDVHITDVDPSRRGEAVARGAGESWREECADVDLCVVAVPPAKTARVIVDGQRRGIASTFTHVASCQSQVQADLEALGADLSTVCGGHPLAGREVSGPAGAVANLFLGRPWVLCPSAATSGAALDAASQLAVACGADVVRMSAEDHDRAVALSSHLPQITASALAGCFKDAAEDAVRVSGPGLQDTTRIAASDSDLWLDVLSANARFVAPLARSLAGELAAVADALAGLEIDSEAPAARDVISRLLVRGNDGRARLPIKRGVRDGDMAAVAVRVPDQPGELARLLTVAAEAEVNVEDVRVEHLSGRQTGLVELLARQEDLPRLRTALAAAGLEPVER